MAVTSAAPIQAPADAVAVRQASAGLIQRQCACGSRAGLSGRCEACEGEERFGATGLQAKLTVSAPDNAAEREADQIAEQILRMADQATVTPPIQRQAEPDQEEEEELQAKTQPNGGPGAAPAAPGFRTALAAEAAGGAPLGAQARAYFEPRFGRDFGAVRIHDGARAGSLAQAVNARAFTHGQHIYFGPGQYDPASSEGRRLLAHELTHTVQQGSAALAETVQRADNDNPELTPEIVGQDPGLLLCFALCELGLPPATWRTATHFYLMAVWEEYKQRYGELKANARFSAFQKAFWSYSALRTVEMILTFAWRGEFLYMQVGSVEAIAKPALKFRKLLLRTMLRGGAKLAAIHVAEQILRKALPYVEVAIAAGCGGFCLTYTSELVRKVILEIGHGIDTALQALQATAGPAIKGGKRLISAIAAGIVARPILRAEVMLDPLNWDLSGAPPAARSDIDLLGQYLYDAVQGQTVADLLTAHGRKLGTHTEARAVVEFIVEALNEERAQTGEVWIEDYDVFDMTPIQFIEFMEDEGYLGFVFDPDAVVTDILAEEEKHSD